MSERLQQARLEARKAARKAEELEEKESYISRLLHNRTEDVQELEAKYAELEKDLNVKEEKWRLQDNDRMRQFFDYKFGQDQ